MWTSVRAVARAAFLATVILAVGATLARANDLSEYVLPAGSEPNGITVGADLNLWFADSGSSSIGVLTTGGQPLSGFPTSTGITSMADPEGIVKGSDGDVWFTEFNNNAVARITPGGVVTEFSLAGLQPSSHPRGIALGANGMLYFTEAGVDRVGRIDPLAGSNTAILASLTESATVPSGNGAGAANLAGIAAGPDGNLWFTEVVPSRVSNITRDLATINEFSLPTMSSSPEGITAGPDGNLWFTESANAANRIGRITTGGTVTEFPIPTANAGAWGITAGPQGTLWFTESNASKIGEITTAGTMRPELPLPPGSKPQGITLGPDGALWFTEFGRHRIGRFTATSRPTVSTGRASAVRQSFATLAGSVNPNGQRVSDCHFAYGRTTAYGSYVPCTPSLGAGTNAVAVSAHVSALAPSTTYHFRVVATNTTGTSMGRDETFRTAPAATNFQLLRPIVVGTNVAVIIGLPRAGRVVVRGIAHTARVKKIPYGKVSTGASRPGAVVVMLSPSSAAKKLLRHGQRLVVLISVTFTPTGGKPRTKNVFAKIKDSG